MIDENATTKSWFGLPILWTVSASRLRTIVEPLVFAIAIALLFNYLQFPVSWLLGPLILGILYAVSQGNPQPLPVSFLTIGKAIIGIATAARFSPETLWMAKAYALPILACTIGTSGFSLFNGYLLARWAGIDLTTGFLGSIPGVASGIVAMSEEMGGDAIAVAVLQYLRLLLVVVIVPITVGLLFPAIDLPSENVPSTLADSNVIEPLNSLVVLFFCGFGIFAGKRLNLPAADFFGTFLVGLACLWLFPDLYQVPQPVFMSGLLLLGVSIGLRFDIQTAAKLLKAVLLEIVLVVFLIVACLGIGYGFHWATGVDTATAILGSTPGGLEAMVAMVVQLGGDTSLVLTMQLSRMFFILALGPILVKYLLQRRPT